MAKNRHTAFCPGFFRQPITQILADACLDIIVDGFDTLRDNDKGKGPAVNAALLSAAVLALSNKKIAKALDKFRADQTKAVPLTPS